MKRIVIWPSYFDADCSKNEGRRVPIELKVKEPDVEDIRKAAEHLGLNPEVEPSKRYPSSSWTKGRVLVDKKFSKQETLKKIALIMKEGKTPQS